MTDQPKFPKVTTGAIILNREGKVFLMRSPSRFKRQFYIPGGQVEWGESLIDSLKREIKEETGLTIRDPEFVRPVEFIFSEQYDREKHIIPLDFVAFTDEPETAVKLDEREGTEYGWLTEEEIMRRDDVEKTSKANIKFYFDRERQKKECEEYKHGWQRAVADYRNLQREVNEQRAQWVQMSEQYILEEFLPVYDNLTKAFAVPIKMDNANAPDGATNLANREWVGWKQGIEHIMRQFRDVLKAHGVEEIKTVGEKFDPKLHETVGEEEVEGAEAGRIVREVEGGYVMNGRVIKVARVIVAK